MDVEFDDDDLDRLETDAAFTAGYSQDVVRAYRKRMQQIRASALVIVSSTTEADVVG